MLLLHSFAWVVLQKFSSNPPDAADAPAGAVFMFPPHKSHLKSYYRAIKSAEEISLRDMGMWPLHNLPPGHASQGPTMSDAISNLESKLQQHSSLSDMRKKIAPKQASKLSDNSAIEYHACVCGMLTAAPRQESFTPAPPTATTGSDQAHAICLKQEADAAFSSTILSPPPSPQRRSGDRCLRCSHLCQ